MQQATTIPATGAPFDYLKKWRACLLGSANKAITQWTVEQLHVEPYQHILEIGFGLGNTLREVAHKLRAGFVAGIDESVVMYQQATKKNKHYLQTQLMQLHLGSLHELPYPSRYFHSIYSANNYCTWKDPSSRFLQLHPLLKSGGKIVTVFQPRKVTNEKQLWAAAEKIQQEYEEAGFCSVLVSFWEMNPASAIAAVGFKE